MCRLMAALFQSCCTMRTGGWSHVFHPRYSFQEIPRCLSSSGSVTKRLSRMHGHLRTQRFGSFMADLALFSSRMIVGSRRAVPGGKDQPRSVGSSQYSRPGPLPSSFPVSSVPVKPCVEPANVHRCSSAVGAYTDVKNRSASSKWRGEGPEVGGL